jgi:hypothetical protein
MSSTGDPDDRGDGYGSNLQPLKPGKPWQVSFAYAYFVGLILLVVTGFSVALYLGIIELHASLSFQVDLGWVVEYLAAILLAAFALFTFVQIVRITGIGFIRGLIRAIARIADNYELPGEQRVQQRDETDGDQEPGS